MEDLSETYDQFVKEHPDYNSKEYTKEDLRKIAYDFVKSKIKKYKKTDHKKYWLVFYIDDSRESCNTNYCDLIHGYTKEEAKLIFAVMDDVTDLKTIDAREMKPKTIDIMNKYFFREDYSDES